MDECDKALAEADALMDSADRNNDTVLAAEQQRRAIYVLLRQMLIETSETKDALKARPA